MADTIKIQIEITRAQVEQYLKILNADFACSITFEDVQADRDVLKFFESEVESVFNAAAVEADQAVHEAVFDLAMIFGVLPEDDPDYNIPDGWYF